ncbi:MAG: VacJ family lipoprotein [Pseudomonadota bacterium]
MINSNFRRVLAPVGGIILLALVSACGGTAVPSADAPDPLEGINRNVHAFNKGLDRAVLKPTSEVYVAVVPQPVRGGVSNGVSNLSEPMNVVNYTLQGDIEGAVRSFMRFGMNTVFGLGGLLDPASDAGLFEDPTDFGETMAVWGVNSGPYVELPIFGPSTTRDAFGLGVDIVADPVPQVLTSEANAYLIGAQVADVLQTRNDFARVIEALFYESADSYAATRIAYLQNRARDLNQGLALEDLEDPYAFE